MLLKHTKLLTKPKKKIDLQYLPRNDFSFKLHYLLIPLISKPIDNFARADTVKADTLLCLRSRMDNFSLLADTLVADTFSTS